jgi:hypothetical protein
MRMSAGVSPLSDIHERPVNGEQQAPALSPRRTVSGQLLSGAVGRTRPERAFRNSR